MKSKNLKEFSNSQIPTNDFVGRKKRSDIAVTPPVLSVKALRLRSSLTVKL